MVAECHTRDAGSTDAMTTALELLAAFVLIIGGAIGFTNAVEWLGKRLDLGAGVVGALLAAVGTALPESVIPIVALVGGGGEEAEQIAIGAIIGAPSLLGTLGARAGRGLGDAVRGLRRPRRRNVLRASRRR
jgi:cation:H+ antiporter